MEISTDLESEHQEEEVGDLEEEEPEEREELPAICMTTSAGRKTRTPRRLIEKSQVKRNPKEKSRRKSRTKFKKFRDER